MLVGSLRLASVWFGFFDIWALRLAVFSKSPMTEVHGRTFGVWTLLTCTLCFLCAFNLDNKQLYLATFLSFIYALGHFLTEYLIYQTMAIANLTTVSIFAGTSIVWMLLQWNAHQRQQVNLKHSWICSTFSACRDLRDLFLIHIFPILYMPEGYVYRIKAIWILTS